MTTALASAEQAIQLLDSCLSTGLSRLSSSQQQGLANLATELKGTPLGAPFQQALAGFGSSEFSLSTVAVFVSVRIALMGAIADCWQSQLSQALNLPEAPLLPETLVRAASSPLGDSVRFWLIELAMAGFNRFETSSIEPFAATLDRLQEDPTQVRLAMVLTGFVDELLAAHASEQRPQRRWADLWSRAWLLATHGPVSYEALAAHGTFSPWGLELRTHSHAISPVIHGVLETASYRVFARATLAAWKVAVVIPQEALQLFRPEHDLLLNAVRDQVALQFQGHLAPGGELHGDFTFGGSFSTALAAWLPLAPLDRHPLSLILPFRGDVVNNHITCGDRSVPLRWNGEGIPRSAVGLIRIDCEPFFQPLAANFGKKSWANASLVDLDKKAKSLALPQLRERASRLLRK